MKQFGIIVCGLFWGATLFAQSDDQATRELQHMSSSNILNCASQGDTTSCNYNAWQLGYELGRRGNIRFLTRSYRRANEGQREVIIIAMTRIKRNPEVTAFMHQVSFKQHWPDKLDTEPRWYALQYLAESCDEEALRRLNGGHNFGESYPVACMYWTDTIRTFGKCKYRPAIPHLIQSINTVACLNISDSAVKSLHDLFPGKCENLHSVSLNQSLDEIHDCFQRAARQTQGNAAAKEIR
jgi:hypothetical protein